MTLDDAIEVACEQPTLLRAIAAIFVWEAAEFIKGSISPTDVAHPPRRVIIEKLIVRWNQRQIEPAR